MTSFCNIPEGFDKKAAIRIDPDPESIATGINQLASLNESERVSMGENGFNLVNQKFTWEKVAEASIKMYKWISDGGEKPDFILTS